MSGSGISHLSRDHGIPQTPPKAVGYIPRGKIPRNALWYFLPILRKRRNENKRYEKRLITKSEAVAKTAGTRKGKVV